MGVHVNFLLDNPEAIAIQVVIDGCNVGRAHWFVLRLAGADAGAGASAFLCGLTTLCLCCLLFLFLGETLAHPVAFLLAMMTFSLAASPVGAIGYSEGVVVLASGFALARLVLGHMACFYAVSLLRDQVNTPGQVHGLFFFFGIKVYCPQHSYQTYTWNLHDCPHYRPCTAYYEY